MLGYLINLNFRSLSILRWNNYPRIENFYESEHLSLKLLIAYISAKILKEKGQNLNLLNFYRKLFWESFFTFIYSDIKFDVKNELKQNYKNIYFKLWEQLFEFLISLDVDERIKQDLKNIFQFQSDNLFTQSNQLEEDFEKFVKFFEIRIEVEWNKRFYPSIYEKFFKDFSYYVYQYSEKIWFDEDDLKAIDHFANFVLRLKFAYRWNRMKRKYPVSVLSHLYLVFCFSYYLALLSEFPDSDFEEILNISLMHDIPEALTGDIITPTKKAVNWFSTVLEKIEESLVQKYIISDLEQYDFVSKLKKYLLYPFEWEVWKIAKYSDNLSAMFEAKIENTDHFLKVYKDIKKSLWMKNNLALDYILKYGVDYFDDDVELAWKKFIGIA